MDFTRKVWCVLGRHKTPDPIGSTYAGVVSLENVQIAFIFTALNGLDVCTADIQNAYLQAPLSQQDYIVLWPQIWPGKNIGRTALIHRALYNGKLAWKDFRNHLKSCMHHLNYSSCPADPDVWMHPAIKTNSSHC